MEKEGSITAKNLQTFYRDRLQIWLEILSESKRKKYFPFPEIIRELWFSDDFRGVEVNQFRQIYFILEAKLVTIPLFSGQ